MDRLIEKVVDPNCYDEQLAPMFFFCHMYFVDSRDLLEKMIGMYLFIVSFYLIVFVFVFVVTLIS